MKKLLRLTLIFMMIGAVALAGCGKKNAGAQSGANGASGTEVDGGQKNPLVTIEMDDGSIIEVELMPEYAPNTVNNFISLVQDGYYDGLVFHRIIEGFVIQGGDPTGTGSGGPGYSIKGEFEENGFAQNTLLHVEGVISMARSSHPDSAGSQFFICDGDCRMSLDGKYAGFGKVTSGMDTVHTIAKGKSTGGQSGTALEPRVMAKVTVDTFGKEYPKPETISK